MNGSEIFNAQLWMTALSSATPLALAALGGTFSERTGVVNIAMEGMMLTGAFVAVLASATLHSAFLGLAAAILSGMLMAVLFAWGTIRYKADQVVVGMAINVLAAGLTGYLLNAIYGFTGTPPDTPRLPDVTIPGLAQMPGIGAVLGRADLLVYVMLLLVPLSHYFLFRTPLGLRMRAVGEHPQAADTAGIDVNRLRFLGVLISGALSGMAGAYISIGVLNAFNVNMTNGRGYIALAAMIFGNWKPVGAFLAAALFGLANALAINLQGLEGWHVSKDFVLMIPYALTILALAGIVRRTTPPAADGIPYEPGH